MLTNEEAAALLLDAADELDDVAQGDEGEAARALRRIVAGMRRAALLVDEGDATGLAALCGADDDDG